ncbi:MAG: glycosyltransferase family 2 protein [candidate division WWE3 bacterium]|nr:glycosyltransferase family 2 protein [candidate division WWE3 bacterium]
MERFINNHYPAFKRFFQILPGVLAWAAILSPFILSLRIPAAVAYAILFMDMYWMYRSLRISAGVLIGYHRMKEAESIDWHQRLKTEFPDELNSIYNLFVIPTYKEGLEIMESTFKALMELDYPKDKIIVILGFEARDDQVRIADIKEKLLAKYGVIFGKLIFTDHVVAAGEQAGPGSNRTYAIKEFLKYNQIPVEKILLTTLDSDFCVHPRFLAAAVYRYLTIPAAERDKRSYTGVFLYNNNYWQTIAPMRLNAVTTAFWQLSEMVTSNKYMNFASMTINLKPVIEMGFWPLDVVNDDSAFFWRAYYFFNGDYKVLPHYVSISADAVQDKTVWTTYKNQYKQYQRWAYGVEHLPVVAKNMLIKKEMPILDRLDRFYFIIQSNVTWAAMGFIVTFGGILLPLLNPYFKQTVMGYNFPKLSSLILTIALVGLSVNIWAEAKLAPPKPANWGLLRKIGVLFQWILTPILIITYGTVPALDAQTRLAIGKYLNYKVTNKERQFKK